ncbi:MAG: HlyD family efflux transporter periplasmic adaptor subunit [Phycisphaerales bacterium]|nr:HlyD family efflux transporter periplasmic adaptor subunit [Phycisphaerales bacterium]
MSTGSTSQGAALPAAEHQPANLAPQSDRVAELRGFLGELVRAQAELVGAVAGGVFLAGSAQRRAGLFVRWPEAGAPGDLPDLFRGPALQRLEKIAGEVVASPRQADSQVAGRVDTVTVETPGALYGAEPVHRVLATPLVADGRVEGASVMVMPAGASVPGERALELLALMGARFEAFLWRQHAMSEAQHRVLLRETLELLDASQQGADARTMGSLMCHEIRRRFGCTRVSIGLIQGPAAVLKLAAISGSEDLDKKGPASEAIEAAMEECALQDIEVLYPEPPEAATDPEQRRVSRAHDRLSQKYGPSSIISLPLRVDGDLVGVVTMEREAADPFPPAAIPLLRLVAEFVGPALWTRRLADRGVLAVMKDRTLEVGSTIVGPRHTLVKLICLLIFIVFAAGALVPIPKRVTADAELKSSVARTIVPPFTGVLEDVLVRPGDVVAEGDLLAQMETGPVILELDELLARRASLALQRDATLGRDEVNAEAADLQIRELEASIALMRDRLRRAEIRSPIAGTVSRGDLQDYVGAVIDPSQPLFEVVGRERVVVLLVDERDIGMVHRGQEGKLSSRARPEDRVGIEVVRINPVAEPEGGGNVYRVEASILERGGDALDWLRAGETGIARLRAGRTTALGALFGPMADELRLRLWW